MIRIARVTTGTIVTTALLSVAALAQNEPAILEVGRFAEGEIGASGGSASVTLRVQAGEPVQLDAIPGSSAASNLDLQMTVLDSSGEQVAADDDSGGSLNPRVSFVSEAGGLYRVQLSALGGGGPFTLLARKGAVRPRVRVDPLPLTDGEAVTPVTFGGDNQALFWFDGRSGEILNLTLTALPTDDEEGGVADPFLELFAGEGTEGYALFQDDDSGGNLGSRIVADIKEDQRYTVRVSSLSGTGRATLRIARMTVVQPPVIALAAGQPATVSFDSDSPIVIDNSDRRLAPYALYRLATTETPLSLAQRRQAMVIRARSSELDPYLEVGFNSPFGFMTVQSNDDDVDLNARIAIDPSTIPDLANREDLSTWWNLLRIRVSAPQGSTGQIEVSAETAPAGAGNTADAGASDP
jgi:hypothetical protein